MSESKGRDRGRRTIGESRPQKRILILCEDEKSSVLYLRSFPVDRGLVSVECIGTGRNTDSLMEEAIRRKEKAIRERTPYESIWVVFDRDEFPLANFNRCFDLVRKHLEISACWSNESFELWYLLHFRLQQTALRRDEINRELSKFLGRPYGKDDTGIYADLINRLPQALTHAKILERRNSELGSRRDNPSTKVHQLVTALEKLSPENL